MISLNKAFQIPFCDEGITGGRLEDRLTLTETESSDRLLRFITEPLKLPYTGSDPWSNIIGIVHSDQQQSLRLTSFPSLLGNPFTGNAKD